MSEVKLAALFVQTNGAYFGDTGIDPWDESRDARKYDGPKPVIAHPPCQRWGKFWAGQPLTIKNTGVRKRLGDDGGCFESAIQSVRKWGGVLEHPEHSKAWDRFGIKKPNRKGGWIKADNFGGWTCRVEQGRYGHYAAKPTWLYAVRCELPELRWGVYKTTEADFPPKTIAKRGLKYCQRAGVLAFKGGGKNSTPRIHTPPEFRDLLIKMALSATPAPAEKTTNQ